MEGPAELDQSILKEWKIDKNEASTSASMTVIQRAKDGEKALEESPLCHLAEGIRHKGHHSFIRKIMPSKKPHLFHSEKLL